MTLDRPWRVLLVEDSPFLRYAARAVLLRRGFDVLEAADGPEALEILGQTRPDVVLLDLVTPRVSGEEVLRAVRSDPALATIPVMVLGNTEETIEGTATGTRGGEHFVDASLSLLSLADRVDALLHDRRVA